MIGKWQFGLKKHKFTKQAIRILINTYENALTNNRELWAAFYNIYKAYNIVEFWAIEEVLLKFNIDKKIVNCILNLCSNLKCKAIFENAISDEINIKRGLKQEDLISPLLFILFLKPLLK